MKSNVFKYLFIIFVIIIVIVAFLIIRHDEQESQNNTQESDTQVQQVKDIRLGIAQFDTLNPLLTHNKNIQDIAKLIFEPLVDISADYKATPALATEWAKQDATTYIIKLRENVKWSNGERFTSADVQFTYDRLKENSSIYSTKSISVNSEPRSGKFLNTFSMLGEIISNSIVLSSTFFTDTALCEKILFNIPSCASFSSSLPKNSAISVSVANSCVSKISRLISSIFPLENTAAASFAAFSTSLLPHPDKVKTRIITNHNKNDFLIF